MNVSGRFLTEDIVKATGGVLLNGDMGIVFRGISTDTRIIKPGYLFWCLKGVKYDGHDFWKEAIDKGAKGLIFHRFPEGFRVEDLPKTIVVILVKDTLVALGDLASWWRKELDILSVAITGSCGKTTTKEMACKLVSGFFKCVKTKGNFNNLIGVPLTLLGIKKGEADVGIFELGTNAPGEIKRLAEIVAPRVSVITCVRPSHLEGLGSIEGVLKEKFALFEKTQKGGTLVYPFDDELVKKELGSRDFSENRLVSFGLVKNKNSKELPVVGAEILEEEPENIRLKLWIGDEQRDLVLKNRGKHNLLNLLASAGICIGIGVSEEVLLDKIEELKDEIFSVTRLKEFFSRNIHLIDDTYNANPSSVESALDYVRSIKRNRKLLVILGDMKELGKESSHFHESIGTLVAELADAAFFVGDFSEDYLKGFKSSGKEAKAFSEVVSLLEFLDEKVIPELSKNLTHSWIILVKGSRALRMERVVEFLVEKLNLKERGEG